MKRRLFIAVKINAEENILDLTESLKHIFKDEKIRWVNYNNLHLTLKFLGSTDASKIPLIKEYLSNVSDNFDPFHFNLNGIGYFGSKNNPRVFFIKIDKSEMLKSISFLINEKMAEIDIKKEEKDFKAHLTIGRIKHIQNKKQFFTEIEKFSNSNLQKVNISELILYESKLTSEGPVYKILSRFPLKNK